MNITLRKGQKQNVKTQIVGTTLRAGNRRTLLIAGAVLAVQQTVLNATPKKLMVTTTNSDYKTLGAP